MACDIVKDINGKPSWEGDFSFFGKLAPAHGLVWGGDWGQPAVAHSFRDTDHVQRIDVAMQPQLFEKQRQKDLKSKDPRVRAGVAAYGDRGEKNGVHVGLANLGEGVKGKVDAVQGSGVVPLFGLNVPLTNIQVTINSNLSGSSLAETIVHEGTHVADDRKFLGSYDFNTGKYDSGLNPYHLQTEFNAYRAGPG